MINETAEKLQETGRQILLLSRNQLYLQMRFLDVALSGFSYGAAMDIDTAATDGFVIYYNPRYIGGLYREDAQMINRLYLHMALHCIFRHLARRNGRDKRLWDVSCDIAIESMADSMQHRSVRRARAYLRRETYRELGKRMKVLTAEKVYGVLKEWNLPERKLMELEQAFYVDNHGFWPEDDEKEKQQEFENRWKDVSEKMETDMETFSKEAASASGDLLAQVKVENKERPLYREFLRKFSVLKEEIGVDQDSFDYVFYSYGLQLYGNMPLIEPQEWKETKKIEEFVIVIDTSMSCSGELVGKFLEETYAVLGERDSYFRKVNIHIIQCDDTVQSDRKITSREELKAYMDDLKLRGEGGTDFRPAFDYVNQLLERQEFSHLKGLLYFTDGQGIYPAKMPPYETAFVFFREDYEDVDVPPWAIRLVLEEQDLEGEEGETGETTWI